MHGAIGFQDYWLKLQGYKQKMWREGKNLLQLIVDQCFEKDIDVCTITSEEFEIPKGSVHDRIGYLEKQSMNLPRAYKFGKLGENILIINRNEKKIYLINGQTVVIKEDNERFDYLVIGSNQVPNQRNFKDTHTYCNDHNLIKIAEHPKAEHHFGMGFKRLKEQLEEYHAIEGHNAQMIIPKALAFLPKIGKYNKAVNEETIAFAKQHNKPYIAVSDAHDISGIGATYMQFEEALLNLANEQKFIESLKNIITNRKFSTYEGYQKAMSWLKWTAQFQWGITSYPRGVPEKC